MGMLLYNFDKLRFNFFNSVTLKTVYMKYIFSLLLLLGFNTAFAQNPIDGNWKGIRETPNGTFEVNYTFKVEGNVVTGVWKTQFGESKLEDGKIEGKKFSYSITFNENKISSTAELINENEILVKNERGEMKLSRVK